MRGLLEEESSLATARDGEGVSALLRARSTSLGDVVEAIRPRVSRLDAFEAAAFGDVDRLAEVVDARPAVPGTVAAIRAAIG